MLYRGAKRSKVRFSKKTALQIIGLHSSDANPVAHPDIQPAPKSHPEAVALSNIVSIQPGKTHLAMDGAKQRMNECGYPLASMNHNPRPKQE